MNKTILYGAGISTLMVLGFVLIPNFASAQSVNANASSGYQQMLETKAGILGITKDELIKQLETKTFEQITSEKNISEDKIHVSMQEAATKRWTEKGLSESEISERLERMKERQTGDHILNSENRGQGFGRNHLNQ